MIFFLSCSFPSCSSFSPLTLDLSFPLSDLPSLPQSFHLQLIIPHSPSLLLFLPMTNLLVCTGSPSRARLCPQNGIVESYSTILRNSCIRLRTCMLQMSFALFSAVEPSRYACTCKVAQNRKWPAPVWECTFNKCFCSDVEQWNPSRPACTCKQALLYSSNTIQQGCSFSSPSSWRILMRATGMRLLRI